MLVGVKVGLCGIDRDYGVISIAIVLQSFILGWFVSGSLFNAHVGIKVNTSVFLPDYSIFTYPFMQSRS